MLAFLPVILVFFSDSLDCLGTIIFGNFSLLFGESKQNISTLLAY